MTQSLKERLLARRAKRPEDHPQSEPLRNPDVPEAVREIERLEAALKHVTDNHANVVKLKRDQERRKNEWRKRALEAEALLKSQEQNDG